MTINTEWRAVNYHNAHEHVGNVVRVAASGFDGFVYSTLRVADRSGFTVDSPARINALSYDWGEALIEAPLFRSRGEITLDGVNMKRIVEATKNDH